MLGYLIRRVVHGALVLLVVALLIYGIEPALRPENYPGQAYFPHVWRDVRQALLHLDFGHACQWPGCPSIHTLWMRGIAGDLWMLGGGLLIGIFGGVSAGAWCARRPGTASARFAESVASLLFCAPVYVVGLGLLLLFNRDIGVWPVHWFFDALPAEFVSPTTNPWDWFRAYLVPWIIVAAPLAAACLRLTARLTVEELDTDHVRTAIAKGLPYGYVVRHHAARAAYPSVTSLVWSYVPIFVTNIVFVEWVWNVPGFWFAMRRALDQDPSFPGIDVPMLKAISLWTALIIVLLSVAADVTLAALDPRVRSAGRV